MNPPSMQPNPSLVITPETVQAGPVDHRKALERFREVKQRLITCVLYTGCWLDYTYYDAIQVLRQTHERARDCFDLSLSALVLCA